MYGWYKLCDGYMIMILRNRFRQGFILDIARTEDLLNMNMIPLNNFSRD